MSKDAYYFQHDSNAHNDPKMLALRIKTGWEGIGLYWTFLEILRDMPEYKYNMTTGYLKELELRLSHPQATLEAWLDEACSINLLVKKDGFLYSESFLRRMREIDQRRAVLSEAGRRGGIISSQAQARLKPPSSSKEKENKEKESKEKENKEKENKEHFPFLEDKDFEATFRDFLEMRKKIRKPATDRAQDIILQKLHTHSICTAIEMLKQSIVGSWTGIFDLKKEYKNGSSKISNRQSGEYAGIEQEVS